MTGKSKMLRTVFLLLTLLLVLGTFILRLMQIQIVDGASYRSLLDSGSTKRQTVEAARGEIVDRNGVPLAVNVTGYNIVLDKAFLPSGSQNDVVLELTKILMNMGEKWIDNLPITMAEPFEFLLEGGADMVPVDRLKKDIGVQPTATADDLLYWMADRYKISGELNKAQLRTVAGVRYEMERRGFNMEVPYTFATDVSIVTVARVKEQGYRLPGADVAESPIRTYVGGDLLSHVIGFTGPIFPEEYDSLRQQGYRRDDTLGKAGIEKAYENTLRGSSGTRSITINSSGDVVDVISEVDPVPGNTVMLTIDSELQRTAMNAIAKEIRLLQDTAPAGEGKEADAGCVVAIDCETGEILAAANYPSYDRDTYRFNYKSLLDDPRKPLINRAIQGTYAAGSIYKPSVATAALANGVCARDTTINCTMVYTALGSSYQPKCLGLHGPINVLDALRYSCNIYFYESGRRLGIDRINKISAQYGLGQPTGIEIPESVGELSSPESKKKRSDEPWYEADTVQSAIGQLYNNFSPVQLANYAATIANRGRRMEAHIVKSVNSYDGSAVVTPTEPREAATVEAAPDVFETVIEGMVRASRIGTARRYFGDYPLDVASKTGTPETKDLPNSTFIAFAPADKPKIAVVVILEKGWHGYTGAPVAKAVFDHYFYDKKLTGITPGETPHLPEGSAPAEPEAVLAAAGAASSSSAADSTSSAAPASTQKPAVSSSSAAGSTPTAAPASTQKPAASDS